MSNGLNSGLQDIPDKSLVIVKICLWLSAVLVNVADVECPKE